MLILAPHLDNISNELALSNNFSGPSGCSDNHSLTFLLNEIKKKLCESTIKLKDAKFGMKVSQLSIGVFSVGQSYEYQINRLFNQHRLDDYCRRKRLTGIHDIPIAINILADCVMQLSPF